MKRSDLRFRVHRCGLAIGTIVLLGCLPAGAQTPAQKKLVIPLPAKPAAPKAAAPKAAVKATAVPAAKSTVTPTTQTKATTTTAAPKTVTAPTAVTTAASKTALPSPTSTATTVPGATTVPAAASSATALSALPSAASTASSGYSAPAGGDPRAPVIGQGVGDFIWPGGWTLTAYGCFRTGNRLFCDFDTTNQNNVQVNTTIWSGAGGVNVVDDGGKITTRHNAFFVGTDGSQFSTAYVGPQAVRFIIEYDGVDQRYTSVSLVLTNNRIAGVPITTIDPSQPAGTIPARVYTANTATGAANAAGAPGSTNGFDKAQQAISNVNDQKKKAQSLWQSVQSAAQPH